MIVNAANHSRQAIKKFTDAGKPVAKYTAKVEFYPQNRKPGQQGIFTYRSDNVRRDYANYRYPILFNDELEAIDYKINEILHKCRLIELYDNSKPFQQSLSVVFENGICIYPKD